LGFWCFRSLLRLFGLRPAYGLLYFVCVHYLLFDRAAVRGALAYARRRFPEAGALGLYWHVYRIFVSQGKQLVDRFAAISGLRDFDFELLGMEQAKEALTRSEQGVILLTAHVGNWQIAMTALQNLATRVYLVMRPEDNEAVSRALRLSQAGDTIRIISTGDYLGGAVAIMNALKEGSIVSIMGDRPYDFESIEVDFLGCNARFPVGAFKIAAVARCPVLVLISARTGVGSYLVDLSHLLYPVYRERTDRDLQIRQWTQQFADILTEHVEKWPYQCFLFHDVWTDG